MSPAYGVAIQADGKIVAVGGTGMYTGGGEDNNFALARYNPDGSADRTFGDGGRVAVQLEPFQEAHAVAIQDDGKIVAAGTPSYGGAGTASLARYNPDGTPDVSFGENGWVELPWIGSVYGVAVRSDGRIVVAGGSRGSVAESAGVRLERSGIALARYGPDGALDGSFGSNDGWSSTSFAPGSNVAYSLAIQRDGRIIVVGRAGDAVLLARYEPKWGGLDRTFGRDGSITARFAPGPNAAYAVALQPDGRILVAGRAGGDIFLARFEPNGSPDRSFGRRGLTTTNVTSSRDVGRGIAVQADGGIVVAGGVGVDWSPSHQPRGSRFAVLRYRVDGSLDPSFGRGGLATAAFGERSGIAYAVATEANGSVVVAGSVGLSYHTSFAIARYLDASGTPTEQTSGHVEIVGTSSALASSPARSLALHLECEGGIELDIVVPSDGSYAGLVDDSNSVGLLKGVDKDVDGTPEFLVPGFTPDELTLCDAFSGSPDDPTFEFIAYVLFTPRGGEA